MSKQSKNRGRLTIQLAARDIDILDKIEKLFDDQQIYIARSTRIYDTNFIKNFESATLSIYDTIVRKHISKYVPYGKKFEIVKPPYNMPNFKKCDYIRGLTDADGSLGITSNNRPFWGLCTSSEDIKNFILKEIKKDLGLVKRINRNRRDNVYNISIFDESAVIFTRLLYQNAITYLNRKYNKYLDIQNWVRSTPKRKGCKKT